LATWRVRREMYSARESDGVSYRADAVSECVGVEG
jgi:hypothetical protein